MAKLYRETGKHEKAETYYKEAIEKGVVAALNDLANFYSETGKLVEAETYYKLAIDKGLVMAMYNLADLYRETGKPDQAEGYYLRAIEEGHLGAMNNLANLYSETGKHEQAEAYYQKAIVKGLAMAIYNLADLYRETGKLDLAETYYLKAIDHGHLGALNNLANLYSETNRQEQAEANYLRAIAKGDENALFNLALFDYNRCMAPARAIELLGRLLPNKGLGAEVRCLEAILLTWSGRPEEAESIETLLRALLAPRSDTNAAVWVQELLVHHRTNEIWTCFTGGELGISLKEQLQPLYYATAKLIGKAGEDALRVMPTELASSVDEILDTIAKERKRYYPSPK